MARTLAFGAALSQGTWPCQEDGFLADPTRRIFAVADGFGGRGAGDMAVKLALAALRAPASASAGDPLDSPTLSSLRAGFHAANKQILERNGSRPAVSRGGASLLVAQVKPNGEVAVLHTGVCAAFLVKAGTFFPVLLPQAAPRKERMSLLPDHALGFGEAIQTESRHLTMAAGDILFLASGGLDWESEAFRSNLMGSILVREAGSSLEELTRQLIESLPSPSWNRTLLAVEMA